MSRIQKLASDKEHMTLRGIGVGAIAIGIQRTAYGVSVICTRRSFPGPPDTVRTRFHSRTW